MRVQLRTSGPLVAALGVVLGVCALLAIIGADSRWLAAVGRVVARQHAIPRGVPFASGATGTWANVPVLAELAFYGLERTLGDRGLMLAELAAVGAALVILARDALAGGATQVGSAWALMLGAIGCLPALAVVRVQLFSLVLFPALVALLRAETRQPSRRIWLAVPLLALWSNLHGAALIGLGLTLVYLSCARLREDPRAAVGVGMAAAVAVCATPAGIRTIAYYHGLLTNQIAARGEGLWAPLSLSAPLDLLLIIAGTGLALQFFRASPSFWERVALAPLAAMTVEASRSGVWLLFFLIPTAARAFRLRPSRDRLLSPLGAVAVAALILGIVRGPIASGASRSVVIRAITLARGTPVLAEGTIAEQVALAGGRVWAGDPIDAFSTQRQSTYLDWVDGRHGDAALRNVDVVLVTEGSPADQLMAHAARFSVVDSSHGVWLYTRTDLLSGRKRQHPCQGSGGCHIEKNL